MIPINCPSCGAYGEIPLDRLNSRMSCKKCRSIFYMDSTGAIVMGDPREASGKGKKKGAGKQRSSRDEGIDFSNLNPLAVLKKVPTPVLQGVLGVAVAVGIIYGAVNYISSLGPPSDLEARAEYAGGLFADRNLDGLQKLALEGTEGDLQTWYEQYRDRLDFEGPRRGKNDVKMSAILRGGGRADRNESLVSLTVVTGKPLTNPPANAPEPPARRLDLVLHWIEEEGSGWKIDGTKTLESATELASTGI